MKTIRWSKGLIVTIDQTRLPEKLVYIKLRNPREIADAIKNMKIRGAPLIGAAAALALAQTAYHSKAKNAEDFINELKKTANLIRSTRPTAVNLFNAIDYILKLTKEFKGSVKELKKHILDECFRLVNKDYEINRQLSLKGAELIEDGDCILTHCNAGELATVGYGTALGVIKAAFMQGKKINVIITETRPLLQGARLTAFELKKAKIPFTLITDNMVGYVMWKGLIRKVIVGADRILLSGHVINKIGTYTIAVLAQKHSIPFYVAAPTSTIDSKNKIEDVIIEERKPDEVLTFMGRRITPKNVKVLNPAFDITPPELIAGIITEKGVIRPLAEEIKNVI